MKQWLFAATAFAIALNLHAQGGSGSVLFSTAGAPNQKRVWINDTGIVGDGALATGAGYAVALYWGSATETDDRNLMQIGGSTTFFPPGAAAGMYSGGGRTINYASPSVNGAVLSFQVRGWSTADGNSYESVMASGRGRVGKNAIFLLKTRDEHNPYENPPPVY